MQNKKITYNAGHTFIPADKAPALPAVVAPIDAGAILPPSLQTHHTRQDDDAISHAHATLLVSAAYIIAAGMITIGLLVIVWLFRGLGDGWATYTFTGLVAWGVCTLAALFGNRRQSLHHSASGIAHAEIASRERLARHAIDQHVRLLLARWDRDNER